MLQDIEWDLVSLNLIAALTAELALFRGDQLSPSDNEEDNEVALRVRVFAGEVSLAVGDPCYDQDHRGDWGYSTVSLFATTDEIASAVREAVDDLLNTL